MEERDIETKKGEGKRVRDPRLYHYYFQAGSAIF